MTIPKNPTYVPDPNNNQALLPEPQTVSDPICSWRLRGYPLLELQVCDDGENIQYSVFNHHKKFKRHWACKLSSPSDLMSVFKHCIWKSDEGIIESRLFRDKGKAVLVSIHPRTKKVGIKEWGGNYLNNFLITHDPNISAVHDNGGLLLEESIRETQGVFTKNF